MSPGTRLVIAVVAGALSVAAGASAQTIQTGTVQVRLQMIADGLGTGGDTANFSAQTPDPRFMYVGQQNGVIRILDFNQPSPLIATTLLNIPSVVPTFIGAVPGYGERGLLGGAFHPDFDTPGAAGYRKFYTYTSESIRTPIDFTHPEIGNGGNHQSVIREWTAAPTAGGMMTVDTTVPSRVLMRVNQPGSNHNGGALVFGPDKYLYIAFGDGGGSYDSGTGHTNAGDPDVPGGFAGHGNAQDRRNIYGSIARIKPTTDPDPLTSSSANGHYRIPNDNPFTAVLGLLGEIYAYGLRNPFRISFDRATGKLYAGDVGQDRREEIDLIVNGGNYGWVAREGLVPTFFGYEAPPGETFIDPIADYRRGVGGGYAVIGGFVYRGSLIPELQGKYIFGDLLREGTTAGGILYMDISEPGPNQVFDLVVLGDVRPTSYLHGIAEDASGELYFLFSNGQMIKLVPEPAALAPLLGSAGVIALRRRRRQWRER